MDYFLLPTNVAPYADVISRRLYEMSRPEAMRDPADVTMHYCATVTHPETGEVALTLTGETMPLHPENIPG